MQPMQYRHSLLEVEAMLCIGIHFVASLGIHHKPQGTNWQKRTRMSALN